MKNTLEILVMRVSKSRFWMYGFVFVFFLFFYGAIDFFTENEINESTIFQSWTVEHAKYIVSQFRNGRIDFIRDFHFYPLWGTGSFLALTDLGGLYNPSFLFYRLFMICCLALSTVITMSILYGFFDNKGWWVGFLFGFNPIFFQMLGGLYDQFFFAALFCLGAMLFVKSEVAKVHVWFWRILAGVVIGYAVNVRADLTYTFLFAGIVLLVKRSWPQRFQILTVLSIVVLFLMPWAWRYYQHSGLFSLSSANVGSVAYISLGQRPENPWGIAHLDGFHSDKMIKRLKVENPNYFAKMPTIHFVSDPWASRIYFKMYQEAVLAYPWEYAKLTFKKFLRLLFWYTPRAYLVGFPSILVFVMGVLHLVSIWVLLGCGVRYCLRPESDRVLDVGGLCCCLVILQVSLFQYIDRHFFSLLAFQNLSLAFVGLKWYTKRFSQKALFRSNC